VSRWLSDTWTRVCIRSFPEAHNYALVRDPIERAISYYDCINPPTQRYTHPDWALVSRHPIEEFYRLPFRDNTMTRILCGRAAHRSPRCDAGLLRQAKQHVQRKFALVGFQDDLKESAKVFLKMLNKPSRDVSLERENARQTAPGREGRPVRILCEEACGIRDFLILRTACRGRGRASGLIPGQHVRDPLRGMAVPQGGAGGRGG